MNLSGLVTVCVRAGLVDGQHDARLEQVLKHALAAELDASCPGRNGRLTVPARWKWKLLHDVNELEVGCDQTSGSREGTGWQPFREPFSYRLWLMVHTGLQHVTHADTLLELQLVIHNSGATSVCKRTLYARLTIVISQALPTYAPLAEASPAASSPCAVCCLLSATRACCLPSFHGDSCQSMFVSRYHTGPGRAPAVA